MKLLVVILNCRVTDLTIDCLRSLAGRVDRMPGTRVAVLENGSGGDAFERIRSAIETNGWGGWAELTEVHPDRGFTGGNNVVIRAAFAAPNPPEYVLLLNADTIVGDGTLERLVESWIHTPARGSPVARCMVLRRTMLEEIGLLDEGLYTYSDDIDLCLRAQRANWESWFVPESRVVRLEGRSTGIKRQSVKRRPEYWFQARRRFYLKSYGSFYTALLDAVFLAGFALWRVRRRIQGKEDRDPPQMLGDSWRNSVVMTGFALREMQNPSMRESVSASQVG